MEGRKSNFTDSTGFISLNPVRKEDFSKEEINLMKKEEKDYLNFLDIFFKDFHC